MQINQIIKFIFLKQNQQLNNIFIYLNENKYLFISIFINKFKFLFPYEPYEISFHLFGIYLSLSLFFDFYLSLFFESYCNWIISLY